MQSQEQDILETFDLLESKQPQNVSDIKHLIHENFNSTKDSSLLNSLYDYYLVTESSRCVEVLVAVREPHDKYLMDRMADGLRGSSRLQSLNLMSHLVRKQPTWLFKMGSHSLMKEFFKVLKTETDVVPVMCALLTLITILPMIPSLLATHLQETFEVFSRLASWISTSPSRLPEEHRLHLQVGLYVLFHRLYGLFPCNFLSYLRVHYAHRTNRSVFLSTVKPMLHTVKMHPLLVTASKEAELTASRWKKMEHHDVLVECTRFSLDVVEASLEEEPSSAGAQAISSLWPRRSVDFSAVGQVPSPLPRHSITSETAEKMWSPSFICDVTDDAATRSDNSVAATKVSEKTSPPEAAVEATPESTPLSTPIKGSTLLLVTSMSVPSSPQCREVLFPESPSATETSFNWERRDSLFSQRLQKVVSERQHTVSEGGGTGTGPVSVLAGSRRGSKGKRGGPVLSPLKISAAVQDVEESEKLMDEVRSPPEEAPHEEVALEDLLEDDDCLPESDVMASSSVTGDTLHMVDTRSIADFVQKVKRLRFYSQCVPDTDVVSVEKVEDVASPVTLRRATSWPEITRQDSETAPVIAAPVKSRTCPSAEINPVTAEVPLIRAPQGVQTCATQTDDITSPLPYEHLFPALFPIFGSQAPPTNKVTSEAKSPHDLLDECMNIAASLHAKEPQDTKGKTSETDTILHKQMTLLYYQLLFERHRRQVHAERNRRLASKSNSLRSLEEHNTALKEQLTLAESDMKAVRKELTQSQQKWQGEERQWQTALASREEQLVKFCRENEELTASRKVSEANAASIRSELEETRKLLTSVQASEFQLQNEVKKLREEATRGRELEMQLQQTRSELLLLGELQDKSHEQLRALQATRSEGSAEAEMMRRACKEEVASLQAVAESKSAQAEGYRARAAELEAILGQKEAAISEQKRLLKSVKEEAEERVQSVEAKYSCLQSLNVQLESELMETRVQLEEISSRASAAVCMQGRPRGSPGAREGSQGSGSRFSPTSGAEQCVFGSPQLTESVGEDVVQGLLSSSDSSFRSSLKSAPIAPGPMQNLELLLGEEDEEEEEDIASPRLPTDEQEEQGEPKAESRNPALPD